MPKLEDGLILRTATDVHDVERVAGFNGSIHGPEIVSMTRSTAVVLIEATNQGRLVCVAQGTVTIRRPKKG